MTEQRYLNFLSAEDCALLMIDNSYTPASCEEAVVALAEPAESRTIPPRGRTSPDRNRVTTLMKAFGTTPVPGPDPLRPSNSDAPYLQGE